MNLTITCPACKKTLTVPAQYAGTTGHCTHCRAPITVPHLAQAASPPPPPIPNALPIPTNNPISQGFGLACGCFLFLCVLGFALLIFTSYLIAEGAKQSHTTPTKTNTIHAPTLPQIYSPTQ